ncbi:MAG: hypothetical protein JSW61_02915 [Candidatus Thorarchaeota archaeon]|nr:MAG: hypothetical protein JSW61_02915 [Candidatus Thorarchaeota archaeon]
MVEIGPGLGPQPSDSLDADFTVNATGLVSRTLGLWSRKIVQYTLLMGGLYVVYLVIQTLILIALYGTFGLAIASSVGANPIGVLIGAIGSEGELNYQYWMVSFFLNFGGLIFLSLAAGAIVKFSLDDYGTPRAGDVSGSVSFSFGKAVTLISVQLITGGLASAVLAPGNIFLARGLAQYDPNNPFDVPSEFITAMPLIFGGLIGIILIQIVFAPLLAVVIAEDVSILGSFRRAYELSSGNFLHIFGGYILVGFLVGIIGFLLSGIFYTMYLTYGDWMLLIPAFLSTLLVGSLSYIFITVLYRDLASRASVRRDEWW